MGMRISMLTLTVRHNKGQSLSELLSAMEQAYTNIQATQAFKTLRNDHKAKFVRVLEVTHGKNGWHPHFHIAIVHTAGAEFDTYRAELEDTWIRFLVAQGLQAPRPEIAVNIVENASNEQRGWYLTKASGISSLEFTGSSLKEAREGNLGIWQIHALAVNGDPKAKAIWLEYENSIRRKRIISPSRGMAEFFGVEWKKDTEIKVDEMALSELPDADKLQDVNYAPLEFVGAITPFVWQQIRKRKLTNELRFAISLGYSGVREFLDVYNISGGIIPLSQIRENFLNRNGLLDEANEAFHKKDRERADELISSVKLADLLPQIEQAISRDFSNF